MSDCMITNEQLNEYIKRGDAMTCEISVSALREDKNVIEQVVEGIMNHIKNVPSADVVAVVRCGRCKFHDPNWCSCTYWFDNSFDQQTVKDDDYCSFGKPKEE